jgi:serine/threonine-protein kinase
LSPDASRLVLDVVSGNRTDIWIKRLPAGPFTRLTFEGKTNIRPSWTSDGRSVLFISDRGATGRLSPWRQREDGGAPAERMTADTIASEIRAAVLSRDGDWLVYHELNQATLDYDILALRPGRDSSSLPLLASWFAEAWPSLSSDGKWLAYVSQESGRPEVYVRPFPNVGAGRWQVSTGGGTAPRWAHSGRELFYQADPTNAMMAVSVTLAPSFTAGTPRKLFDVPRPYPSLGGPYYDVTPDDRRFIMARVVSSDLKQGPAQLVVVENFREEVRRKLSAAGP